MKIAAICAYPSGLNPGMLSVDFALDDVISNGAGHLPVERFCLESKVQILGPKGVVTYNHLQNTNQLSKYDLIIFWGDFLHWSGYARQDFLLRQLKRDQNAKESEIIDAWYKLCLLEGSANLQKRTIIFGSTVYGLQAQQLADDRYMSALSSLYDNAKLVKLRDSLSASFAQQLTAKAVNFYGCDCAFLLDTSNWISSQHSNEPYILCSFGRSGASRMFQSFASLLGALSKTKVINMSWFDSLGFEGLKTKINLVKHAKLIVTDIYHLSVTALREHTPVICIGRGAETPVSTLSDKKKEILFYQSMLAQNYLFLEDLHESFKNGLNLNELAKKMLGIAFDERSRLFAENILSKQSVSLKFELQLAFNPD